MIRLYALRESLMTIHYYLLSKSSFNAGPMVQKGLNGLMMNC